MINDFVAFEVHIHRDEILALVYIIAGYLQMYKKTACEMKMTLLLHQYGNGMYLKS